MSKNIFVFVEQRGGSIQKVSLELIGEATRLAADLGEAVVAVLMGHNIADKADMLCQYGADEVLVLDHPVLAEYTTEPYVKGMEYVIRSYAPNIVLFGARSIGRDMAPRIAGRIHTGLTADCTRLDVDVEKYKGYLRAATSLPEERIEKLDTTDRNLKMTRPAFGGNLMATIICPNYRPQMATVRPGVMEMPQRDMSRQGKVTVVDAGLSMDDRNVEILQVVHDDKKPVDITEAKVLVSGGRGGGSAEGYAPLRELAEVLGFHHICTLTVQEHDKMIGYVSQLCHAIAVSLMCANDNSSLCEYTGDSFRDLTRIARINEKMWAELFLWNKENLISEIDQFDAALQQMRNALVSDDRDKLEEMFRLSTQRRAPFDKKDS